MSQRAFLFGILVITVLIFSLYRAKDGARDTDKEIAKVEAEIVAAKARQVDLQAELAHRSRQEWIEEYARHNLGMVPPSGAQFVRMDELETQLGPVPAQTSPDIPESAERSNE